MLARLTDRDRIEMLEEQVCQLKARIAQLTGRDELHLARLAFGLTAAEGAIFMVLFRHGVATYGQLLDTAYFDAGEPVPDGADWCIRSHVKRIRRKTRPFGVDFETVYGSGYRMSSECRSAASARFRRLEGAAS